VLLLAYATYQKRNIFTHIHSSTPRQERSFFFDVFFGIIVVLDRRSIVRLTSMHRVLRRVVPPPVLVMLPRLVDDLLLL
jgi:hypothetical protein